jgi:hypothetical protein
MHQRTTPLTLYWLGAMNDRYERDKAPLATQYIITNDANPNNESNTVPSIINGHS